jgi:hypothetical protein
MTEKCRPVIYDLCKKLLECNVFPTPTIINEEMGRGPKNNNINGRETAARTKALKDFGYIKGDNGRWQRAK